MQRLQHVRFPRVFSTRWLFSGDHDMVVAFACLQHDYGFCMLTVWDGPIAFAPLLGKCAVRKCASSPVYVQHARPSCC